MIVRFVARFVVSRYLRVRRIGPVVRGTACLGALGLLSACAGHQHVSASQEAEQYEEHASRTYVAPGSASDPWGPYVTEASQKYDIPERWIREVMRVESGGHAEVNGRPIRSGAGAMGLMQVMPATFDELRGRYPEIGSDPYDPHNSVLAGSAYLRELYDLYGNPGFLAAYNGGPGRLDDYLTRNRSLPDETRRYVAKIGPYIADSFPGRRSTAEQYAMNSLPANIPSGPRYASAAPYTAPASQPPTEVAFAPAASGDDAAFEPPANYRPALPRAEARAYVQPAAAPEPAEARQAVQVAALPVPPHFEPIAQQRPAETALPQRPVEVAALPEPPRYTPPAPAQVAAYDPPAQALRHSSFRLVSPAMAEPVPFHHAAAAAAGQWAIQVGAFGNETLAHSAVGVAREQAHDMLASARPMVAGVREPHGTLYRARLGGLSRDTAVQACQRLSRERTNCMVLSPDSQS